MNHLELENKINKIIQDTGGKHLRCEVVYRMADDRNVVSSSPLSSETDKIHEAMLSVKDFNNNLYALFGHRYRASPELAEDDVINSLLNMIYNDVLKWMIAAKTCSFAIAYQESIRISNLLYDVTYHNIMVK